MSYVACAGSGVGARVAGAPRGALARRAPPRPAARAAAAAPRGRGGGAAAARVRRVAPRANIFSRLSRVVRSYANNLLDKAEDPETILDQTVVDMTQDLTKLRQATAQVMASQKQLERKYEAAQGSADEWYKRAQLALSKGDEELAREALKRKKSNQDNADQLQGQLDLQKESVEKLLANGKILETKLLEAKSKKDTLKARAQSAKTQKKVNEIAGAIDVDSSLAAFEKMEQKVMALESEADAVAQLGSGDASLENKFKELEGGSVDDELAAMKAGMLKEAAPPKKLPEGRPIKDAIDLEVDAELEALRKKANEK